MLPLSLSSLRGLTEEASSKIPPHMEFSRLSSSSSLLPLAGLVPNLVLQATTPDSPHGPLWTWAGLGLMLPFLPLLGRLVWVTFPRLLTCFLAVPQCILACRRLSLPWVWARLPSSMVPAQWDRRLRESISDIGSMVAAGLLLPWALALHPRP